VYMHCFEPNEYRRVAFRIHSYAHTMTLTSSHARMQHAAICDCLRHSRIVVVPCSISEKSRARARSRHGLCLHVCGGSPKVLPA
jgi:hypothetical protein